VRKVLESLSPCDIADGLAATVGFSDGGLLAAGLRHVPGSKPLNFAGPAYVVEYAAKDDPRPAVKGSYIDSVPKDSVLVLTSPKGVRNAIFGGLMATRAGYLGAKGAVIDGFIRDVGEQRNASARFNYSIMSRGVGIAAPAPAVKVVQINEGPARTSDGGLVYPGDWIIGDENGVARVEDGASTWVEKVCSYSPRRVEADQLVMTDILAGKAAAPSQK
ncbi:hypothetical protein CANCADRAFT_13656, partial [Tortispora caseinolytica NRRL Y-17796]